ncbi:MAG: cation:proton antiporter [Prevotella sp.]|nr:cation:proton antiporter [Prevotella sp.]MDY4151278.1 cation:proton antiporter [Prevotella sp.]
MAEIPHLIQDLALILMVAGLVTLLFKKLRQPLVLGYIVAGFLVSPHMPYLMSVVDKADIQTWADIGVMFLLFSLGLDFSFKKILKMGMAPVIAALTIIFCMMALGTGVGTMFGWSRMNCLFLAGMLAMSSTTIIYKALDDLGLRQQRFAGLVMSVLILEDVLAIVMMVMLSTIARGANPDGSMMIESVSKIVFFLVLWFVVGIFLIPPFLRKTRRLMNDETLVVVALGLCCAMAVLSTTVGFSSAFGAFVMGSILAETIEADKITTVVEPVKNLFGAIFFVSVGMLVDPAILVSYAVPILVLVLTILVGQAIFGTMGFMLSGQPLKTAMRCGFSMAQIGEFAFIIASLGLSLRVISDFLYPVVVAVSVITTFLTPYMMKAAIPCYEFMERRLPRKWIRRLDHMGAIHHTTQTENNHWRALLKAMAWNVVIYSILSVAVVAIMLSLFLPFMRRLLPGWELHWWANGITGILTVAMISPFLRSMIMKKNHSEEFKALWTESRLNRLPLIFTVLVRVAIGAGFIFYICNYLSRFKNALIITIALVVILLMALSRRLKHRSIRLERLFVQNLRSRDIAAQVSGKRRPLFEGHLLDRDIHISEFIVPVDSLWAGKTLAQLKLGNRFGVHVSSILRGSHRINIPDGNMMLFVGDKLQAIGNDEQLNIMNAAMQAELLPEDADIEHREMKLQKLVITADSPLVGKTLKESNVRQRYNFMVVGVEEGQKNLTMINPNRRFEVGDIVWVVGEEK